MSEGKRLIEAEDIFKIRLVGEPRVSPDGKRVLFTLTRAEKDADDYRAHLWLRHSDGSGAPRQFTNGTGRDTDAQWSPDGSRIAFVSTRSGHSEIWLIPADGGEARRLTHTPHGASYPRWSPDGSAIVFSAKVGEEDPKPSAHPLGDEKAQNERKEKEKKRRNDEPRHYSRLRYKNDGAGLWEGRYSHLWVIEVGDNGDAAGEPRQLTSGDFDDLEPAWSPDGQYVAFTSRRTDADDRGLLSDIFVVPAGGGAATQLTGSRGYSTAPSWSPDGMMIAYIGHEHLGDVALTSNERLFVLDFDPQGGDSEKRRELTASIDRPVGSHVLGDTRADSAADSPTWTADGKAVLLTVSDWGRVGVWRFPLSGDAQQIVGGDRQVVNVSYAPKANLLAFNAGSPTNPGDLYAVALDPSGKPAGEEIQLTEVNRKLLDDIELGTTEEIRFAGPDCDLQGWVIKPPHFEEGKKYPGLLEIHGGPHLLYGFSFVHEFQVFAAQGWVVFFMNPRGSQGYGEDFSTAIRGCWGTPDYEDIMRGADVLLEQGYVDPANFGVTGGSYGGFMTTWIVGHTDRFKVALAQRSVTNLISMYGSSDIGWGLLDYDIADFFADPKNLQLYWDRSPIAYVANVKTPIMLTHSENDLRCNIEQSEEYYVALRRLGKTAEFVRYPHASHGLSRNGKPKMRVHRLDIMRDWLVKYLG